MSHCPGQRRRRVRLDGDANPSTGGPLHGLTEFFERFGEDVEDRRLFTPLQHPAAALEDLCDGLQLVNPVVFRGGAQGGQGVGGLLPAALKAPFELGEQFLGGDRAAEAAGALVHEDGALVLQRLDGLVSVGHRPADALGHPVARRRRVLQQRDVHLDLQLGKTQSGQ